MKQKADSKTNWIIFIAVVLIVTGLFLAFYLIKNDQPETVDVNTDNLNLKTREESRENSSSEEECTTCNQSLSTREEAKSIVDQFQSFQTDREANNVISLMTEPETANEENDYAALGGTEELDRLYSANELTFKLVDYEITESEKISEDEYWFYVTETRKNWDMTTGDWTKKEYNQERKFEVEKSDDDWLVDKYTTPEGEGKYAGFSNVN